MFSVGSIEALDSLEYLDSLDLKAYKSGLTLAIDSLDCLDPLDSLGYLELYILQADAECGAYGDVIHAF